jgi:hypothetical protein
MSFESDHPRLIVDDTRTANEECDIAHVCSNYVGDITSAYKVLIVLAGICWAIAYCCYIISSHRLGEYRGIPAAALAMNVSWEFCHSFVIPNVRHSLKEQLIVNRIWVVLDFVILIQFIQLKVVPAYASRKLECLWYILLIVTMSIFFVVVVIELNDTGAYSAFLQNLLTSILFCYEAWNHSSSQEVAFTTSDVLWSTWIPGILRWIGSAFACIAMFSRTKLSSPLLFFLYVTIFFWDTMFVLTTIPVGVWKHDRLPSISQPTDVDHEFASTPTEADDEYTSNSLREALLQQHV